MKKKSKNKLLDLLLIVGLFLPILGVSFFFYIITFDVHEEPETPIPMPDMTEPEVITVVYGEPEHQQSVDIETLFTYNHTQVELDVINEFQSYFEEVNVADYKLDLYDANWMDSSYTEWDYTIHIGVQGITNNSAYYRLVFTHEFVHYVWYRMGLTNDNMHEAMADMYTWTMTTEASKEVWGERNENRQYPYTILTQDIISRDPDCFKKIFDTSDRIKTISQLLQRTEDRCNVDLLYIINSL